MRKDELKLVLGGAIRKSREAAARDRSHKMGKWLLIGFAVSIVATMLPIELLNFVASFVAVLFLVGVVITSRQRLRGYLVWSLLAASIISGCAGPIFSKPDLAMLNLCSEITGGSCKEQTIQGWYLFGIALDQVSAEKAAQQGGIKKVVGIDRARGFGLIGLVRVTVVGS